MSKAEFEKRKFAGSLPTCLVLPGPLPSPGGAFGSATFAITDRRIILDLVHFITPNRIRGLLHYEGPNGQIFFMGYGCGECHQIFLVPNTVHDDATLAEAMRWGHACVEGGGDAPSS